MKSDGFPNSRLVGSAAGRRVQGAEMGRFRILHGVCALCLLSGCGEQDLFVQLAEPQANETVAALRSAGVPAEKVAREGGVFAVRVPQDAFPHAVEILRAQGLPRGGFDTLGQVFRKDGFLSSPLEERARLTHALSQEIANTLSSIDGVVLARVHVSMPERDRLADKPAPAAASVFLKHRAGLDLTGQTGSIKALVVHSIDGLAYENVTVAMFPADDEAGSQSGAQASASSHINVWAVGGMILGSSLLLFGTGSRYWNRMAASWRSLRHGR
jgi:type III secretion protein J